MAIPLNMPNSDDIEDSYRLDLLLEQLLITLRQVLIQRRRMAAARTQTTTTTTTTSHHRCRHETVERTRTAENEESNEEDEDSVEEDDREREDAEESSTPEESTRVTAEEEVDDDQQQEQEETTTPASMQLPLPDLVMDSTMLKESEGLLGRTPAGRRPRRHQTRSGAPAGDATGRMIESESELIRLAGQLLHQEEVDAEGKGKVRTRRKETKGGLKKRTDERDKINVLSLVCPLLGNSVWTTVALLVVLGLLSCTSR